MCVCDGCLFNDKEFLIQNVFLLNSYRQVVFNTMQNKKNKKWESECKKILEQIDSQKEKISQFID